MRYLCLVYEDESMVSEMPPSDYNIIINDVFEYLQEIKAGDHLIEAAPLESTKQAVTVRVRGGNASITDGPFAETKEQLGGFFLIEARDLNDAIRLASRMPPARHGIIEVRPLKVLDHR